MHNEPKFTSIIGNEIMVQPEKCPREESYKPKYYIINKIFLFFYIYLTVFWIMARGVSGHP